MIDDIALFVHIVEHRNLAKAANSLKLPPATVTRRLKKLEETLNCRLIHRSARKFSLTTEGESYYQAYAGLVKQFEETAHNLSADIHQLHGPLKVLAPQTISVGVLSNMWSAFISTYPDIQLDLQTNNTVEDIMSSQIDLALRIGPQTDSALYQKRLGRILTVLVAAPDYLTRHGTPHTLSDLHAHRLIGNHLYLNWTLFDPNNNQKETIYPHAATLLNDVRLATHIVREGAGIALLPMSEVYEDLKNAKIQRILPPWVGAEREIFAVWPSGRLLSAKAKCLLTFMSDYIGKTDILQGTCSA
ncbi:MAG: LysR family transcriptional regulator [Methylocystaceae bacterium]|nr:LysR family transcriptional regulator [Methylocystaceae bacterium]